MKNSCMQGIFLSARLHVVVLAVWLAVLWAYPLQAESPTPATRENLAIGAVLHLTGDLAEQSSGFLAGIQLAVHEINSDPSARFRVTLKAEDGRNSSVASNSATQKLLTIDRVSAVIVGQYLDASASAPLFERRHIPALILWDASPEIDAMGRYIFSIGPWVPSGGEATAKFLFHTKAARTVWIVKSQDPFSDASEVSFSKRFSELGGRVVGSSAMTPDETNFRSIITKLKAAKPDAVLSLMTYNLIPWFNQLRELRYTNPVVSCNCSNAHHLQSAPQAFEGRFQYMNPPPAGAVFERVRALYEREFKRPLTQHWFVATGYDAVQLLVAAATAKGSKPEQIAEGLYQIKDHPGANGSISISEGGSWPQHEKVFQIQNGEFVPVQE